jgi:signal transduction histidine kinase
MPSSEQGKKSLERTDKFILPLIEESERHEGDAAGSNDLLSRMEKAVDSISRARPHLSTVKSTAGQLSHYQALLEVSAAINGTLVTDEILQVVMRRAIELLKAERGFLMLLDENNELRFRTVYNLQKSELEQETFKLSNSIANQVARSGESVYTSDAQADDRYSSNESVAELNLRSIMCVPLKIQDKIIGVIYLDNSSEARLFLESDLYLFELLANQAAIALNNSRLYERILRLKTYNENIVSNSPVGLLVLDRQFRITTMNTSAERIFQKQHTPGMGLDSLLGGNMLARWNQGCQNVRSSGMPEEMPRCYVSIGEAEKVLSVKISPLLAEERAGNGIIVVIEDITEKVILENYVTVSEKLIAKGEMAASVAHELNNYLAIISNNAELMEVRLSRGETDKIGKSCQAILENIDKIQRFTDNLMDLSQVDQERVSYNLSNLIDDLIFSVKSQQRFRDVTFVVRNNPNLPDCQIDVGQIQQVFLNLLYNAADAMKESSKKREIIVTTAVDGDKVIARVRDSGFGIRPEHLEKVFEPHFSTKTHGHGLGLANCRNIVENHGGTITVNSELGEFTEFSVILPAEEQP